MPTEPDNNIEEQLKAWAAKRRADAGSDFELHPATRRLLQDEVARNAPAPRPIPETSRDWLAWLRPRMAMALSVVAMMLLVGIVFLPAKSKSKAKQESILASNEPNDANRVATRYGIEARMDRAKGLSENSGRPNLAPPDAQGASPTVALGTSPSADRFSEQPKSDVSARRTEAASTLARKPAEIESPARASSETKELAPTKEVAQNQRDAAAPSGTSVALRGRYGLQRSTAAENRAAGFDDSKKVAQAAPSPVPAERQLASANADQSVTLGFRKSQSPAAPAPAGLPDTGSVQASTLNANFSQNTDQSLQHFTQAVRYRRNFNSPPMPNVLTTFQLEQSGQQLRIVDADGSVYEGGFLTAAKLSDEVAAKAETDTAEGRKNVVATQAANQELGVLASNRPAAPQSFAFRVVGTNRWFKPMVVFTWNHLYATSISPGSIGNAESQQNNAVLLREANVRQEAASNTVPQTIPRLEGRVLLGERESIEINATPVPPQ
jgi:hypothetical protein